MSVPPLAAGPVTAVTTGTLIMDTYEIEKLINSGGMGEVYRGRNVHNGEPVAIKIVLPALAHDPKIVALFQKESTVLSRLSHEAIVRYHTFTIDRSIGRPCMVMEFVSGLPLGDRVEQGPMPLDEVKVMFRRVASGLEKAHRAGVVHRDLSPDNVILEEGSVDHAKLIDFGIAKSATIGGGTLLGGQFAGKFNWVSPEQLGAFGGVVDGRSDIYSLALLVAAASRGKVVSMGESIVDAVGKRAGVPDLTGVDPELLPLLRYMLQPDPDKRPARMADVIAALDNPALVPPEAAAAPADPNRTVIGGALPVAAPSQPPGAAAIPTAPPIRPAPMPGTSDWSVPTGAPVSTPPAPRPTAAPTVIASQPPVSLAPHGAPVIEPEDVSPFGAPGTAPPQPSAPLVAPAPAGRKAGGGMLAALAVLVVLGGGVGAYFAGVFGFAQDQTDIEANRAAQAAADAAARAEAEKAAEARRQAEAAQQAAERKAEEEAAKAAAEAAAQAEADAKAAANRTAEEQATAARKAAEEAAAAQKAAEEAAAKAEAEAAAKAAAEADAARRAEAEAAAKAAADAARADPAAAQAAWLASVAAPKCVRLVAVPGQSPPTLAGYASSTEPLEALARDYTAALGRAPDIAPKLINDEQCPVIDFVNRRQTADAPTITLRMDNDVEVIKSGKRISGVIEGIAGRPFVLLLVGDGGGATNMSNIVTQEADGTASFKFALGLPAGAPPAPQVLLVITTDAEVPELEAVPPGVSAKSLVPYMEVALKNNAGPMSLGLGFFRLEN